MRHAKIIEGMSDTMHILNKAWRMCRQRVDPGPAPARWRIFAHRRWLMKAHEAKHALPSKADIYAAAHELGFQFYDDVVMRLIEIHGSVHAKCGCA